MGNVVKNATFTTMIEGVLTDLMLKTTASQVIVGDSTLDAKLQEVLNAINGKADSSHTHAQADVTGLEDALTARPTTEAMNSAISAAISELIGGAPETYDTLKEIADYIEAHKEVVDALNAAIGNKADASVVSTLTETVNAIKAVTDGLGALATKDKVTTDDLDDTLAEKVAKAHTHSNSSALGKLVTTNSKGYSKYPTSSGGNSFGQFLQTSGMAMSNIYLALNTSDAENRLLTAGDLSSYMADLDFAFLQPAVNKITALETASAAANRTYYSATQPEGMKNGDTWFRLES